MAHLWVACGQGRAALVSRRKATSLLGRRLTAECTTTTILSLGKVLLIGPFQA